MDDLERQWIDTLFSREPADHKVAESGLRDLYRAAEFDQPMIVWLDSPAEACHAVLLLCAERNPLLRRIATGLEQLPGQRAEFARIRKKICESLSASDWNVVPSVVGAPLAGMGAPPREDLQGKLTLTRISFWNDPGKAMGKINEDDLSQLETQFWGVIVRALPTVSSMLESCITRKYHLTWMAIDEAEARKRTFIPPLLPAAWQVARSAGPWWPFRNAAIITERPLEVHCGGNWMLERGDGPALRYRDGWQVFAWNGQGMHQKWIEHPQSIPPRQLKQADKRFQAYVASRLGAEVSIPSSGPTEPSVIFKAKLPPDVNARIKYLRTRNGGKLPFFDRYVGGDRLAVWKELIGLGSSVRNDPYAADGLAVAYETMRRVRENVSTLIGRLKEMGYRFSTEQSEWDERKRDIGTILAMHVPVDERSLRSPHVQGALEMLERTKRIAREQLASMKEVKLDSNVRPHVPPAKEVWKQIQKLERKLGVLPLSLRAFYEVVGSVDLMGQHPNLTPRGASVCPDPLVVFAVGDGLEIAQQLDDDAAEDHYVMIAPDEIHKAGESGGEGYEMAVPDQRADGELLNERHQIFFVDYLRMAFSHGGFPGYEGYDDGVPQEIAQLRKGLLEI